MSDSTYELLRQEALAAVEAERLDPVRDQARIEAAVGVIVERYQQRAYTSPGLTKLRDPGDLAQRIVRAVTGFGPLTELFTRADVQEILIEGDRVDYKDESGRVQGLVGATTLAENRRVVDQLLAATNRRLDAANPIVQARVLDGTARLTALIDPVAEGLCATIRRYTLRKQTLASLTERGSLTQAAAGFLWAVMQAPTPRLVVSGRVGAGKTSLLSALLSAAPTDRIVRCCESVRELHAPLPHASFWEAQGEGLTGGGGVSLRQLVKTALAMAADMIVVGEVRGEESYELTRAMNAGTGFAVTVHSNTARDGLEALVNTALMAGENVPESAVRRMFASAIDFVVHLDMRDSAGKTTDEPALRQVTEIIAVAPSAAAGTFTTETVFERAELGQPLKWTGYLPPDTGVLQRGLPGGSSLAEICDGRSVAP